MSNLFIIDDDPIYNRMTEIVINKNMLFEHCSSYTKAGPVLNYLIAQKNHPKALPDVILLDLNMPEMDGWNFLALYEDLLPFIKKPIEIFIMTSSSDPKDELRAKAYSFVQGYFKKPLTAKILLDILKVINTNSVMRKKMDLVSSAFKDITDLSTPKEASQKAEQGSTSVN